MNKPKDRPSFLRDIHVQWIGSVIGGIVLAVVLAKYTIVFSAIGNLLKKLGARLGEPVWIPRWFAYLFVATFILLVLRAIRRWSDAEVAIEPPAPYPIQVHTFNGTASLTELDVSILKTVAQASLENGRGALVTTIHERFDEHGRLYVDEALAKLGKLRFIEHHGSHTSVGFYALAGDGRTFLVETESAPR